MRLSYNIHNFHTLPFIEIDPHTCDRSFTNSNNDFNHANGRERSVSS